MNILELVFETKIFKDVGYFEFHLKVGNKSYSKLFSEELKYVNDKKGVFTRRRHAQTGILNDCGNYLKKLSFTDLMKKDEQREYKMKGDHLYNILNDLSEDNIYEFNNFFHCLSNDFEDIGGKELTLEDIIKIYDQKKEEFSLLVLRMFKSRSQKFLESCEP